jgi:hypothetical protein
MLETKFHSHTKQLAELLYILTFTFLESRQEDRRLSDFLLSLIPAWLPYELVRED